MRSRNRRVAALMMAVVMTVGSVMTASAADGTGTYEGQDGTKPVMSITLPTDAQLKGIYNYIADPNDLIGRTEKARLGNVSISNNEGILFAVSENQYGNTSKMITVESKNYQDVDVTVEVKVKPDAKGDADIKCVTDKNYVSSGTDKNLYLAVVSADKIAKPGQTVSTSRVAILKQTAKGVPGNYSLSYNSTKKYHYAVSKNTIGWNSVSFALTGAINKNANWGEGAKFPTLQVTWSYKEHTDGKDVAEISISNTDIYIRLEAGQNALQDNLQEVRVNNVVKSGTVTTTGKIKIAGAAVTGKNSVKIVYDGVTYTGSVTK